MKEFWQNRPSVAVYERVTKEVFEQQIKAANRPAILKGFVRDWEVAVQASQSIQDLCNYFLSASSNRPIDVWCGSAAMKGRFFYDEQIKGRNFTKVSMTFAQLCTALLDPAESNYPHMFAGAVYMPEHLPELLGKLPMTLLDNSVDRLTSLWIGNRTRTAAHWDLPQNLACVVAGRRRFILFPPSAIPNLYFGPLDNTPAGQPISLVDFHNPDLNQFPLFPQAISQAEVAELEPGDVLYMPSMWVHHVESLDDVGAMINFWWRDQDASIPTPLYTLIHSLLTLGELPLHERQAWEILFNYYVFSADEKTWAYIPVPARGILQTGLPEIRQKIKHILMQSLGR